MRSTILLSSISLALLHLSTAQSTMNPISEISDGQPQAPGPVAAATGSPSYSNPETSFTTETNSLGVVTGQPSVITSQPTVVTSQPSVVTSQPAVVTSPAGSGSVGGEIYTPSLITEPVPTAPGPISLNSTTLRTSVTSAGGASGSASESSGVAATNTGTSTAAGSTAGGATATTSGSSTAPTTSNSSGAGMVRVGSSFLVAALGFAIVLA